ncbi:MULTISPECIES: TerB family tellurite resistance protein [Mangrovimonas]|uniref:tellurite resistance TerB family protein n=1 Tax=Mangrovimonas TaxID=1211036 RepID=UPI0006B6798B|nr:MULTISPECIES: TerB family tellurite resistance protein [Mangrovimonas]OMP32038.1 fructose 1,6-bisphosphatase [Mangrovimonas sp. DI 80]
MSISDLFDSGFKKRNEDHFAAIVRVAMSDGIINEEERAFLDRLARNLGIDDHEYATILKDYKTHPINPPTSYELRLERLFDLARMVWVDHIQSADQVNMLEKFCVGLGFRPDNAKYITDKALHLVQEGVDIEIFKDEMKAMNK